ncbi:MAG: hypothetical protein K2X27_24125 [Candidatus Obscuribacterales bacterium]|nr:hypothetical protein [Candidatus Obscuribacterales bacterium]
MLDPFSKESNLLKVCQFKYLRETAQERLIPSRITEILSFHKAEKDFLKAVIDFEKSPFKWSPEENEIIFALACKRIESSKNENPEEAARVLCLKGDFMRERAKSREAVAAYDDARNLLSSRRSPAPLQMAIFTGKAMALASLHRVTEANEELHKAETLDLNEYNRVYLELSKASVFFLSGQLDECISASNKTLQMIQGPGLEEFAIKAVELQTLTFTKYMPLPTDIEKKYEDLLKKLIEIKCPKEKIQKQAGRMSQNLLHRKKADAQKRFLEELDKLGIAI